MKHAAYVKILCVILIASLSILRAPVRADVPQPIPLSQFEAQVDDSLVLSASQAGIDASAAALDSAQAKAGRSIELSNSLGPQRDVVDLIQSRTFVREEQDVALKIPLLGTLAAQQQEVATASGQLQVSKAEYQIAKQELVGRVREAYINYWMATQSQQTSEAFVADMQGYGAATAALSKNGFWTQADNLRYQDMISKGQMDEQKAVQTQQNALAELSLLTNKNVLPFQAVEPGFAECQPNAVVASRQAIESDPQITKIKAEIAQINALVPLQKWDGYDADVRIGAGAYVDSKGAYIDNQGGLGYRVYGSLDVDMPTHPGALRADELKRLAATGRQLKYLLAQREAELNTGVTVAIGDRNELSREIAQAGSHVRMLAEDVREARVRFTYVAPSALTEVQSKEQEAYNARMWILTDQNTMLLKLNDLLQFAPEACSSGTMAHTNAASFKAGGQ